jgi:hypothetical protein
VIETEFRIFVNLGVENLQRNLLMKTLLAALIISLCPTVAAQQFSSVPGQGRSMVVTKLGIVAAPRADVASWGRNLSRQSRAGGSC